jgi:plastocyanin
MPRHRAWLAGGVLLGVIGVTGCGSGNDAGTAAGTSAAGATPAPMTATVGMQGVSFTPETVNVKSGGTVTWRNTSAISHNVTAGDFASKTLDQGAAYRHTYPAAGRFSFRCTFHAGMKGTVVVTAS